MQESCLFPSLISPFLQWFPSLPEKALLPSDPTSGLTARGGGPPWLALYFAGFSSSSDLMYAALPLTSFKCHFPLCFRQLLSGCEKDHLFAAKILLWSLRQRRSQERVQGLFWGQVREVKVC